MRVSSKGQVTIPKELRELAGIVPNGEVIFSVDGARLVIEARRKPSEDAERQRLDRLMAALKRLEGTGNPGISAADVMQATRDR